MSILVISEEKCRDGKGVILLNPQKVSIGDHNWIDKYTIIEKGDISG